MRVVILAMLVACGGGTTGGESPDCSNLLECTTTSKNDTGTYSVDLTAGTLSTLNDYGVSGSTAFAIVAVGAYDHVLRFTPIGGGPGGRQFIAADQSLVGGACM